MERATDELDLTVAVLRRANRSDIKYPAAALGYYAFIAFLPVLVIVVTLIGPQLAAAIEGAVPRYLTPAAHRIVHESLTSVRGRSRATLLALVVIAWSGANIANGFLTVVERVEERPELPLRSKLRDALVVLGLIGVAFVAATVTVLSVSLTAFGVVARLARFVGLFAVLTAVFVPLYYVPSRVVAAPTGALPGAAVAALGWTTLLTGVHLYAAYFGDYALYGVLGGIIVILTGLYLGALVLLFGVVVNVTLAEADLQQSVDARRWIEGD